MWLLLVIPAKGEIQWLSVSDCAAFLMLVVPARAGIQCLSELSREAQPEQKSLDPPTRDDALHD